MKLRWTSGCIGYLLLLVTGRAGGFEGGGALDGPIWFCLGVIIFCFTPLAISEGAYGFGAFSALQLPLVLISGLGILCALRIWKGGKRLMLIPLAYIVPIIATNLWAVTNRIDHSGDFPVSRYINEIDWRTPPNADGLVAHIGAPVARKLVAADDAYLPQEVSETMLRFGRKSAEVLVFTETAWETTQWHYLICDSATGLYVARVGYNDYHRRLNPKRWPDKNP